MKDDISEVLLKKMGESTSDDGNANPIMSVLSEELAKMKDYVTKVSMNLENQVKILKSDINIGHVNY